MRDAQNRTAQKAMLLEVVDDLVSSVKFHTGDLLAPCDTLDCFHRCGSLFNFLAVTHAVGSYKLLG
jgi:hypothetical protein